MKITFVVDHQSPWSGNSLYLLGTRADLQHGQKLIDLEVAIPGWVAYSELIEPALAPAVQSETSSMPIERAKQQPSLFDDAPVQPKSGSIDWSCVLGVSDQLSDAMHRDGYHTKADVLTAGPQKLQKLHGIGPGTAKRLIAFARG